MATVTRYSQGLGSTKAVGENLIKTYQVVIDAAKLYADGQVATDSFELIPMPANSLLLWADAQIQTTLANVTSVSVGTTAATPTEYVNAQTDTAVGRFTAYVANTPASLTSSWRAALFSSAGAVYVKFGALGATSSGKVAFTFAVLDLTAFIGAGPRTYTN